MAATTATLPRPYFIGSHDPGPHWRMPCRTRAVAINGRWSAPACVIKRGDPRVALAPDVS